MTKTLLAGLILASAAVAQPGPPAAVAVSGTLTGDDSSVVAGGILTLRHQREATPSRRLRPLSRPGAYHSQSGANGSFRFDRVLPGKYTLCVQVPKSVWLNSCDWGAAPLQLTVAGTPLNAVSVVMRKGVKVPVRVDDPVRVVSQNAGRVPGAHLLVGAGANDGLFRPATLVSEDAGGRTYENLIPFEQSVKVVLSSRFFQLADEIGRPVQAQNASVTVSVPRGQVPQAVRLIVTGQRSQ